MLLSDAKIYVAKIIGAQADTNALALAEDSINATYRKWQNAHNWAFLLQDNSINRVISDCTVAIDQLTVTSATAGALYFTNVGMTVTGIGVPAGTTVAAVDTETTSEGVTSFTLSQASTAGAVELTFGPYIAVVAGQELYNLPSDLHSIFSARLLDSPRTLYYMKARELDRRTSNQDNLTTPTHYAMYTRHSFNASTPHAHIKLIGIPGAADRLFLKYYRMFSTAATTIDIPNEFLYVFLDDAQCHFLLKKNAGDPRLPAMKQEVAMAFDGVLKSDEEESEDDDIILLSQMEVGPGRSSNYSIWDDIGY
jgi:hypothetical protein